MLLSGVSGFLEEDEFLQGEKDHGLKRAGARHGDRRGKSGPERRSAFHDRVRDDTLQPCREQDQADHDEDIDRDIRRRGIGTERGFPVLKIPVDIRDQIGQEKGKHIAPVAVSRADGALRENAGKKRRKRCLPAAHREEQHVDENDLEKRDKTADKQKLHDLPQRFRERAF